MAEYGMIVDLNKCIRCRTCYVARKIEHNIPAHPRDNEHPYEYYRLRYVEWEWGKYPNTRRAFIPISCMQCGNPPYIKSCPIGAIIKRNDGIIAIKKGVCTGCGVCTTACPYGALYITSDGKADVCDFYTERLSAGLPPKCVEVCNAGARIFGNLDDSKSEIAILTESGKAKPLLLKEVTRTRVFYVPSPNEPDWSKLRSDESFMQTLDKRNRDLPPIQKEEAS